MNQFTYAGVAICPKCKNPEWIYTYDNIELTNLLYTKGFVCSTDDGDIVTGICRSCYAEYNFSYYIDADIVEALLDNLRAVCGEIHGRAVCDICRLPEGKNHDQSFFREGYIISIHDRNPIAVTAHVKCLQSICDNCEKRFHEPNSGRVYDRNIWRLERNFTTNLPATPLDNVSGWLTSGIKKLVGGEDYCSECFEIYVKDEGYELDDYTSCIQCDRYELTDDMCAFEDNYYCDSCYSDYIRFCDECDQSYHNDDQSYHDHDEDEDDDYNDSSVIHNYSYKPAPVFFGHDKFHMGFELEVEAHGNTSRYDGAEVAQNMLGVHAYMKDDGSLENGFEIVTHPHTLNAYQKEFSWEFIPKLITLGFRSWNAGSCGIHVHISRSGFGIVGDRNPITGRVTYSQPLDKRILARQAHELRFIKLIYDNSRQVERLAGRSTRFATFSDKGNLVYKVKGGVQRDGHYSAVNTENADTLEVRVFKGSLKPARVLTALEFCHAATEYTRDLKVTGKNNALSWLKFCAYVAQNDEVYPNLVATINRTFQNDQVQDNE